jgi:nucleoside-diphosphate-sugar epimerase
MKQVAILGAVNPVGCRLAEALCDRGVTVVALVDDWVRAARLARLPFRMIEGSVDDPEALGRAMEGCGVVFHCAEYDRPFENAPTGGLPGVITSAWRRFARTVDSAWALPRRNLDCVDAVLSAALEGGIERVICLNASTVATPAERAALRCHQERGLAVTVLRPATLYGPFCPWTIDAVRGLRRASGRPHVRPGPCLYIDHLVEAMLLVAGSDAGAGEVFPLHDEEPASCDELLDAHARVVTGVLEPAPTARAAGSRETTVGADIQRAHRVFGYQPKIAFPETMERTSAWIQWSRL